MSDCTHHWMLGAPGANGRAAPGVCKHCGAERGFTGGVELGKFNPGAFDLTPSSRGSAGGYFGKDGLTHSDRMAMRRHGAAEARPDSAVMRRAQRMRNNRQESGLSS